MYDNFSQDYDHFVNWQNRLKFEISFLVDRITSAIHKPFTDIHILDAATGTGMHAIALAQHGFKARGVDISEGMIQKARKNAEKENVEIRFEMAAFGGIYSTFFSQKNQIVNSLHSNPPLFDVVLCLGNSLPHVEGKTELLATLKDFAACLSPGGLLILQNRNFDAVLMSKDRWMEPQTYSDHEKDLLFLRFYDFLPDGHIQFNFVTLKRALNGEWKQSILETRLFPITQRILIEALEESGFNQIHKFGALSSVPYLKEASGNLVVTVVKNRENLSRGKVFFFTQF
jgi:glycine/sarcosine N-methyltransferase